MTAQDTAVVMVAFIALERSENLAVARMPGKGQPPPSTACCEGWPDGPLQSPSISTDHSVGTAGTRALLFSLQQGGLALHWLWSKSGQWLWFGWSPPSSTTRPQVPTAMQPTPLGSWVLTPLGPQSFAAAVDLLSTHSPAAKPRWFGTCSFGIQSDWARGVRHLQLWSMEVLSLNCCFRAR